MYKKIVIYLYYGSKIIDLIFAKLFFRFFKVSIVYSRTVQSKIIFCCVDFQEKKKEL